MIFSSPLLKALPGRGLILGSLACVIALAGEPSTPKKSTIGQEVSVPRHLADDEEFKLPLSALLEHGKWLFMANWTEQEGGGRPLTKGNGKALSDLSHPLTGERGCNGVSAPDAN